MEKDDSTSNGIPTTCEQKLADARKAISDFFHATDLDYVRVELWQFLRAVTTEQPFSFLGDPSTVLCLERRLSKIITTCRLLLDVAEDDGTDLRVCSFQPFTDEQIEAERQYMRNLRELNDRYGGMIRRLTLAETEQPVLAIKRVFDVYSHEKWQKILKPGSNTG